MKKKLFVFALCILMAVAMAVPSFAAPPINQRVWIFNKANSVPNLNAATSGVPTNNTNVTMWTNTGSNTQRWDLQVVDANQKLYNIRNYANSTVGLNIYRDGTNNCTLYSIASNAYNDKTVKCVEEAGGWYGLVVPAYVLCLTPTGFSDGSNVNWQSPTGASNQLWYIGIN